MAAQNALQTTIKLYQNVVEDVVLNVREAFLDEGIDEAVLHELKCGCPSAEFVAGADASASAPVWESKILATKVIDSLDPNFHMTKTSKNAAEHHSHAPSTSFQNYVHNRPFPSKIKHSSQISADLQSAPQVLVVNPQQQYRLNDNNVEFNHFPNLRNVQQDNMMRNSIDAQNTGRTIGSAPFGTFIRSLPQSVINPQHVIMQLSGGSNNNLHNELGPNLLQTSLTSAIMMQQQRQPQQQLLSRPKYEKITNNLSNMVAQGSNVIVVPPHLQHLASGGVQFAVDSVGNNGQNSPDQPSSSSSAQPKQRLVIQLDGPGTATDDDDDEELADEDDDEEINVEDESEDHPVANIDEGDALNSEDDEVSNENADEMFEADDVVVCQFEKVNRIRNKWKFVLKDGIINLGRRDYVFNKAVGEAEF